MHTTSLLLNYYLMFMNISLTLCAFHGLGLLNDSLTPATFGKLSDGLPVIAKVLFCRRR